MGFRERWAESEVYRRVVRGGLAGVAAGITVSLAGGSQLERIAFGLFVGLIVYVALWIRWQ